MRYDRAGGPVKTEDDPLDPSPLEGMREVVAALIHLERAVTAAGGIVLRYGGFYGADNDGLVEPVRKRQFPIVGDGGVFVRPPGRRGGSYRDRARARRPGDLQRRRRRARPRARVAAGVRACARREAAASVPGLARAAARRRRGRRHARNRGSRRVEREGQARARLDAPLSDLAAGLRRRVRAIDRVHRSSVPTLARS